MAKPDRHAEALKLAVEKAGVYWDNLIIMGSRYDATRNETTPGLVAVGNSYAIFEQVKEWVRLCKDSGEIFMSTAGEYECDCGGGECEVDDEDDEETDEDDATDDTEDEDSIGNRM